MKRHDFEAMELDEVAKLAAEGNVYAIEFIVNSFKNYIKFRARSCYASGADNDDLVQEGMIGLFKAVRDYNEDKDCSFASFAQLCISRQLYSALEASNRKKHGPLNTYVSFSLEEQEGQSVFEDFFSRKTSSPEEWILEQEKLKELQRRMKERLSSMEQQVLELYLGGNNYIQISEILQKSPKSIDNALQRIRQKIRQLQE